MPNWACGDLTLVLPTKNVDKFLKYANGSADKCFYRSLFEANDEQHNAHGLSKLSFAVECAWSAGDCLNNTSYEGCITLEAVCKELKVLRLAANFEERGEMFGEKFYYDQESGMDYESFDLPEQAYIDLDDDEEYIDDEAETEINEGSVTFNELFEVHENTPEDK